MIQTNKIKSLCAFLGVLSVPGILCGLTLKANAQDQGYIGLALRDIEDGHTVVSWMFPGPLNGGGLTSTSHDIQRPDLFVSIDGQELNAKEFEEYIKSKKPGTKATIRYRISKARGPNIPDTINHEDEIKEITITLENRDEWVGTIKRGRSLDREVVHSNEALLDPLDRNNVLGKAIAANNLSEQIETLMGVFKEWQDRDSDYYSLSRTRDPFYNPFRMAELEQQITQPTHEVPGDPLYSAIELIKQNLDLDVIASQEGFADIRPIQSHGKLPGSVRNAMSAIAMHYKKFESAMPEFMKDEEFARKCIGLLRVPKRTFYIAGQDSKSHIEVIAKSVYVPFDVLCAPASAFEEFTAIATDDLNGMTSIAVPREIKDAVEGRILAAHKYNFGWVVIGTPEDNKYDMAKIAVVIDAKGNETYYATDLRIGFRQILDFAGNDTYTGTPEQGPGSALLGMSLIDDRAGDDRYEGEMLSAGAACYGVSLLLDRAGNDIYSGSEWSLGAACYGAGMIFDLGNGSDTYLGEFLCEGVGGPRGFGCIVDEAGRDLYRANGPTTSAYGTPAVYQSFSQGMGWGYRQYAAGGIGMISDLAGDDRYEAGEFAQGGAYYYALGILHDASGRDLYYGNRYGQGFGVHQAHGILADDSGDDTYWAMTAACQGAAWDIGVGLLIDRAGNDTYQSDGLAQGGASMQGIAMLVDLDGVDRYSAGGGATQGQSGGDSYHYNQTGAFSFSLLLDLGGDRDFYSRNRQNNKTTSTGEINENNMQNSSVHGLVIDQ